MRRLGFLVWSVFVLAGLVTALPPAVAAPAADFHTPPSPLPPGVPGDLIRAEPMRLAPSVGEFPAHATRIMYRSIDAHGLPMAVTGTVLDPVVPWGGPGPRPLVAYAPRGHGLGDQCAPSKLLEEFVHYQPPADLMFETEVGFIDALLTQGFAVVVTDYQGLGTPGVHTFLNRAAQAHAQMDSARAAQSLPRTGIPRHGPVGLWGCSQGGLSAGASAELVATYAPDLDVRGSFVGAPAADPHRMLTFVDGTVAGAEPIGNYVDGLVADHPEAGAIVDAALNADGTHMLAALTHMCGPEAAVAFASRPSSDLTVSGRPIPEILQANPVTRAIMDSHNLGHGVPTAPVLMVTGNDDDGVPAGPVRELAANWCGKGASVAFAELPFPTIARGTALGHYVNWPPAAVLAVTWMRDRLAGVPVAPGCRPI